MRRRIRLTGRRQLPQSSVNVSVFDLGGKGKVISLSIAEPKYLKGYPSDARIRLRLNESKFSETLDFGTLGMLKTSVDLRNSFFSAPSCQLRIVSSSDGNRGLLLASTDSWTLRMDEEDARKNAEDGILLFLPHDIAPRIWRLEIREQDYPIIYVDRSIPDPRTWVRNDPVFISSVLPAIIQQIFEEVLRQPSPNDIPWMNDWLRWAERLMPGTKPQTTDSNGEKSDWIDQLLDTFCHKHKMLDLLVGHLTSEKNI